MIPTQPPPRQKGSWRRFLREDEAEELQRLEARASEIDKERRDLTRAMNLIRNRVMVRKAYAMRKGHQKSSSTPRNENNDQQHHSLFE